jgi:hypothetical protein
MKVSPWSWLLLTNRKPLIQKKVMVLILIQKDLLMMNRVTKLILLKEMMNKNKRKKRMRLSQEKHHL